MKQEYFKQKIKAFLHDPPEKPLILGLGKGHEATSEEYIRILLGENVSFDKHEWAFADHVASAADRASFPLDFSKFKVDFRKEPRLTHPNSGAVFNLDSFPAIEIMELRKNVSEVLTKIKELSDGDPERMFLYLWRYFPVLAARVEEGDHSLGLLWNYLPADTRIPDHSVLDHSRVVSAFGGAGIKNNKVNASLLLFTIGPVQEFIAAARKTKDLWAGSYMLSWLSWQGIKVFCEELGPDSILFPDLKGQPLVDYWLKYDKGLSEIDFKVKDLSAPTLPNRFFAVIPKDRVEELTEKAEKAIHQALLTVGQFTYRKMKPILPENEPGFEIWEQQLSNFVQCHWASLDLPEWNKGEKHLNSKFKETFADYFFMDNGSSVGNKQAYRDDIFNAYEKGGFDPNLGTLYGRFYEIVEKSVGSRKALRNFHQLEEKGYRCSLVPGLASLTPEGEKIQPKLYSDFWEELYANSQKQGTEYIAIIGRNERLSPLALTKRFFPEYLKREELLKVNNFDSTHFNSTHALAVADFKLQLVENLVNEKDDIMLTALEAFLDEAEQLQKYLNLQTELPLYKIRRKAKEASVDCQMNAFTFCALPGELLQLDYYDGNFKDDLKVPDNSKGETNKEIDQIAKKTKEALFSLIKVSGLQTPSKYYAILYLDGDNMGKWLSGDLAPEFWKVLHEEALHDLVKGIESYDLNKEDEQAKKYRGWKEIFEFDEEKGTLSKNGHGDYNSKKRPQAPTQHMAISRALNNYSLKMVRAIVEKEFLGRLIYAGGDDVVAMVSLQDALPCAEKLRAAFSGHLKSEKDKSVDKLKITLDDKNGSSGYISYKDSGKEPTKIFTTLGPEATASCGIAIAHYMYPLKQATAEARKAESYAKNELGRDAFAVNIVKRSGEVILSGASWRLKGNGESLMLIANGALKKLADAFSNGSISRKFIVDVDEIIDVLVALDKEIVISEIRRIYNQHNEGFQNVDKQNEDETILEFEKRIRKRQDVFFESCIQPLIEHCDQLGNTNTHQSKEFQQIEMSSKNPADWKNLRNAIRLMDMAYYIGTGGGR